MLNKLNTKTLLIVLTILVATVVALMFNNSNKATSTIPNFIIDIDSSSISRIVIEQTNQAAAYELVKEGAVWKLKMENGKMVSVENRAFKTSLKGLLSTKPKKVVTRKEENYAAYEVTEELGSKLSLYNGDELLASIIIGKLDFNQQLKTMYNFVRHAEESDVFLVDAPLGFDWNKKPGDWRNKTVLQTSISAITKVEANGEMNFSMIKNEKGTWTAQGIEMDSTQIQSYITNLANISNTDFNDEITVASLGEPVFTLAVYTEKDDYNLMVYNSPSGKVLFSSANPENVFNLNDNLNDKIYPKLAEVVLEE